MSRKYKIDYDQKLDCFAEIAGIKSDLIYGDLNYVKNPYISYILPVYKRADLLAQTLDSIFMQNSVDFEWDIVIVDNEAGEANATEKLIRSLDNPKILYYRNRENLGVDGNYNRCIELARGEWVSMLHGDDLIMRDHLSEMARLIKETEQIDPLIAYICQGYRDFSSINEVAFTREYSDEKGKSWTKILSQEINDGKLFKETPVYGIITGLFAAIPSFGTMMKREIMLKEGGFNKDLGICEDVITPFKLSRKYGVYLAPKLMGYHRFDNNESAKIDTIMKIYAAITDFREYMYSTNLLSKIWGEIARDILNSELRNYCIGMSRFNHKRLKPSDFSHIYEPQETGKIKKFIYKFVRNMFNKIYKLPGYDDMVSDLLTMQDGNIKNALNYGKDVLIYGSGTIAEALLPIVKKTYPEIRVIGCVVSEKESAQGTLDGIPIEWIDTFKRNPQQITVITATVIWEYQFEMNEKLKQLGFVSVINLL